MTSHPTSSLGHPLPSAREEIYSRRSAPKTCFSLSEGRGGRARALTCGRGKSFAGRHCAPKTRFSLSEGRGWAAPRAITSGRGPGEGFDRGHAVATEPVALPRVLRGPAAGHNRTVTSGEWRENRGSGHGSRDTGNGIGEQIQETGSAVTSDEWQVTNDEQAGKEKNT